jgi:parallel beta-helix repeat protein
MHMKIGVMFVTGAALVMVGVTATPAQAHTHHTWRVDPGTGTISAAVAKAHPGDTIQLEEGTYYDSVYVPITLTIRGEGWRETVLRPPMTSTNPCDGPGFMEGLCVFDGTFDNNGNPIVSAVVKNVQISDLRITGFSDSGVLGEATHRLRVHDVRADHNGGYGIARFQSTRSVFEDNRASYNGEAGLYMGDSPNAHSVLRDNSADHNGFGLFMRDSTYLTATGNKVWGNCVGILALNSGNGAPGDLPAGNYRIVDNTAWANDKACPSSGGPPLSGIGIALAGVHDTLVADNEVRNNKPGGPSKFSGGIVIASTKKPTGGADPTNNTVRHNESEHNQPADIVWDGTGTGNTISHNDCNKAVPGNLGWCTDTD